MAHIEQPLHFPPEKIAGLTPFILSLVEIFIRPFGQFTTQR